MSAGSVPTQSTESPQDQTKESNLSPYEEKLAKQAEEGGFEEQQHASLLMTLSLGIGMVGHGIEVADSLKVLKSIDPNKLIHNPIYNARVDRAVQLTDRYGRFLKKGERIDQVRRAKSALKSVEILHDRHENLCKFAGSQYKVDMRAIYGFNDEELKNVYEGARLRMKENPQLTLQESMRIEARENMLRSQITQEVEKEYEGKHFQGKKKDEEIRDRLQAADAQKGDQFTEKTNNILKIEKEKTEKFYREATHDIAKTLGVEIKPEDITIPGERAHAQIVVEPSATSTSPTPPATQSSQPQSTPPPQKPSSPKPSPPPRASIFSNIKSGIGERVANIKSGIGSVLGFGKEGSFVTNIGENFANIKSGLGSMLGVGKEGSIASKLGSLGGRLGGLGGKIAGLAGKLGRLLPGLGNALLAKDLLNRLLPGHVGDFAQKAVIAVVIAIAVGLPLALMFLAGSVFDGRTASDPEIISSSVVQTYNWNTFQQAFLEGKPRGEHQQGNWKLFLTSPRLLFNQ